MPKPRVRAKHSFPLTWNARRVKREYLENARQEARPFEPKVAKRIKSAFYVRPNGNIGRWSGTAMRIIGPMRDPERAGPSSSAPMDFEEPECSSSRHCVTQDVRTWAVHDEELRGGCRVWRITLVVEGSS